MHTMALLIGLALGSPADAPECRNPPSRASDSYWTFIEACGCVNLDAPSRTSPDYERFLKACSEWRQRNPQIDVIAPETPPGDSSGSTHPTNPQIPPECRNPPSRASDSYWAFIEACGCANLDAPSRASPDYERFLKACSEWRQRNPQVNVIAPGTPTPPSPNAKPKR